MFSLHIKAKREHAIVIGGGIAGLLATRILADHFAQVTLIERDRYPRDPAFRPGVPQGRQVHTLLLRGQRELEGLFPGLGQRLLVQGAVERDYGQDSLYYYGGRCPQFATTLRGWACSRSLLEWQLRELVAMRPNVRMKEGYEVLRLLLEKTTNTVCGVQLRARNQHALVNEIHELRGDLVVDASGAASPISRWLVEWGYEAPREEVVDAHLGYATCFYEPPVQSKNRWKAIAIQATQGNRRGGSLMEIEGRRWMVVLAGTGEDCPPTEPEAYLAFAHSLPDQALYEAIADATPLSPIYGYRRTENRWRHFEQVRRQPEGLIVMGDALCTFNPLYGQGMTVAILQAHALARCLHSGQGQGLARTFQRKAARVIALPWRLATASDSRGSSEKPTSTWSQRYIEALIELLPADQQALLTFLEVIHLLRSPLALVHPSLVMKVLQHMRGRKRREVNKDKKMPPLLSLGKDLPN